MNAFFSVEGETALVTGGTRGIGQACAVALAEAGADVILVQVGDVLPLLLRVLIFVLFLPLAIPECVRLKPKGAP